MRLLLWLALFVACHPATRTHVSPLTSASVSVRDFGAVGDGITDDRAAVQAALSSGATDVLFPNGVYSVGTGAGYWCLTIPTGVTLRGETRDRTVLQQAPGLVASVRLLQVVGAGVTVTNLTLDGNKLVQTADEHRSGVFATGAPGLTLHSVTARNFTGDGFYLYNGSNTAIVDDVLATDNDRNGITFGGGTEGGTVTRSTFIRNRAQQFDSEGGTTNTLTLVGNTFDGGGLSNDYVLAIAGWGSQPERHSHGWTVDGNVINGGIDVVWSDKIMIRNNSGTNPTTKPSVTVYRASNDVTVAANRFTMTQASVRSSAVVYIAGTGPGSAPARIRVTGNTLTATNYAPVFGVRAEGASSVEISDNVILGPGLVAPGYAGVFLRATIPTEDFKVAVLRRNWISGWGALGLTIGGSGASKILLLDVTDNIFDDLTGAMTGAMSLDDGTGALQAVSISGNVLSGDVVTLVSRYPAGVQVEVSGQRGMAGSVLITP